MRIEEKAQVMGPWYDNFLLSDDLLDHDYVFIATGTGIAPFRGMLEELFKLGFTRQVWLIFGVPYSTDVLYDNMFRKYAEAHSNFHYVTAISRENPSKGKVYVQHRLREHVHELEPLLRKKSTCLYICGLAGMEVGIYAELLRMRTNLISPPDGYSLDDIAKMSRKDSTIKKIFRDRNKDRLFVETY